MRRRDGHRERRSRPRRPAAGAARLSRRAGRRLALVHYTAPPVTGGVELILGAHARLLRSAGHDVRVVAGRGDAELVPVVDSRHPDVERVSELLAAGEEPGFEMARLRGRLIHELSPLLQDREVVVAHNVLTMPFNLPLAAALLDIGRPLLAWTHDLAWSNPRYRAFRRETWPCSILGEPQARTTYVAISQTLGRQLQATLGLPAEVVPVVPNGIDVAGFLGLEEASLVLAERAGWAGADPLVLVPVRITPRKRIELAVEAAARLAPELPRLRVVVSGPLGPHSALNAEYARSLLRLRARLGVEEVVRFHFERPGSDHPVRQRTLADLYRMADCVLLPSESEGFGLPVLEAALARVPLVCAELEVLAEVAGGAERLFRFPSAGRPGQVAAALRRALRTPAARLRGHVARSYGWSVVLEGLERVISTALGG